mgnify:CR=1 FL=1
MSVALGNTSAALQEDRMTDFCLGEVSVSNEFAKKNEALEADLFRL